MHDIQTKELVTSHVEDQQRSVSAEIDAGKWGPPNMGTNEQVSKMATNCHGPVHLPMKEYGLGTKGQVATMDMLKRSDMCIANSGASNHVPFNDKGCRNKSKRIATGSTHGIVGDSVLPKCELDIPCVHFDKDGTQVGEMIITDVRHLFSVTRLQKKGWTLTGNADYIKLEKGQRSLLFNIVINTPKGALYVGKFSRKGGDKVMGGVTNNHLPTTSKRHTNYWGTTMRMTPGKWPVIWVGQ